MSDVTSFGNIIHSLRSVRNDYNEFLKAVPQYSAFLLIDSSTQHVTDTLQGVTATQPLAAEVIEALETAKAKFLQHLATVPEYRALQAIDKLIRDVSTDLGLQPQEPVQSVTEQPSTDLDAVSPSEPATADHVAVSPDQAAPLMEAQAAASQIETTAETPAVSATTTQTPAREEIASAEAISQIHSALVSAEATVEITHDDIVQTASAPAENMPAPTPEDYSADSPQPEQLEAEKAA